MSLRYLEFKKLHNKAKRNLEIQKEHCTGRPTQRFGRLCWRRYIREKNESPVDPRN